MNANLDRTIYNSREVTVSLDKLYHAFANPLYLKEWWGPEGFKNTIHEFDLKPEGKWVLTMHGPEKGNYENSSVFKTVVPFKSVSWTRLSQPFFDMTIEFDEISESKSKISFIMFFKSEEECEKMKKFVEPKNEENFDRLERLLATMY